MTIDFDDTQYIFTHGRAPRGYGSWAFSLSRKCDNPIWAPQMNYSDAKVWMRAWVRKNYPDTNALQGTVYVCT